MLRPRAAATLAALLLAAFCALGSPACRTALADATETPGQALDRARTLLDDDDARDAVKALEDALPRADAATQAKILDLLRNAYGPAADQAEAEGDARQAAIYRENLAILERRSPSSPAPSSPSAQPTPPAPDTPTAEPAPESSAPAPLPDPEEGPLVGEDLPTAPAIETTDEPASDGQTPASDPPDPAPPEDRESSAEPKAPRVSPVSEPKAVQEDPSEILNRADAAFRQKQYAEAGTLYAQLARVGKLAENRRDAWAYCRRFEVVRRINAQPRSAAEWAALAAEIEQIRKLSPRKNWYDEYLRSLVAEKLEQARRDGARKVVLRGASPDEQASQASPSSPAAPSSPIAPATPPPPAPVRPDGSNNPAGPGAITAPTSPPAPEAVPRRPAVPSISTSPKPPTAEAAPASAPNMASPDLSRWQVLTTANFRIYHADPDLARRVSQIAETAREEQTRRWTGHPPRAPWRPLCEIYLYPDAHIFSQRTGQPEDSPGFSTSGLMAGRVTARRINLRADHPKLTEAVLPHEVTHIVLAEIFPDQQIPRWADEGMAVLAEPATEQRQRADDLTRPLHGGRIFSVEQLMLMDYPEGRYWPLYYAQSISLTRFLVEQSSPARFVEFVRDAQRHGVEAALRRHYEMNGYADLQERWLAYARSTTADPEVRTASDTSADAAASRR